jgi:hypothetical protein
MLALLLLLPAVGPSKPEPMPEVILAAQRATPERRALAYSFEVPELDRVPGNAAPIWLRAGLAARRVKYKWAEKDWDDMALPLGKFPVKKFKDILSKHAVALRLAENASLRARCDWERPPHTIQALQQGDLPLDDIQSFRELANLLSLRCRIELAERRFDDAHKTMRIGFTLARHINRGNTLIENLVAIAIGAIFLHRAEEWTQVPGSPNLYWALTALPRPLFDTRRAMRSELGTIYRSFPWLREFKRGKLSEAQAKALLEKALEGLGNTSDDPGFAWMRTLSAAAGILFYHDKARAALLKAGWTKKELDKMPKAQVVALYFLHGHDRIRDDALKLLGLPGSQRLVLLEKLEREVRTTARKSDNVLETLTALLMPAMTKVMHAELRTERTLDGLRAAEALRLHAALNKGKPPAKLADIKAVPLPRDPWTGKPMDDWYRLEGKAGVLTVPPPPGMPNLLGRRFILRPAK